MLMIKKFENFSNDDEPKVGDRFRCITKIAFCDVEDICELTKTYNMKIGGGIYDDSEFIKVYELTNTNRVWSPVIPVNKKVLMEAFIKLKPYKRMFSKEDPYDEEDWENIDEKYLGIESLYIKINSDSEYFKTIYFLDSKGFFWAGMNKEKANTWFPPYFDMKRYPGYLCPHFDGENDKRIFQSARTSASPTIISVDEYINHYDDIEEYINKKREEMKLKYKDIDPYGEEDWGMNEGLSQDDKFFKTCISYENANQAVEIADKLVELGYKIYSYNGIGNTANEWTGFSPPIGDDYDYDFVLSTINHNVYRDYKKINYEEFFTMLGVDATKRIKIERPDVDPYGEEDWGFEIKNESKIPYQKQLCEDLWDGEDINKKIEDKLINIAKDFFEDVELDTDIIDIHLTGSMANYNYNENSDIDVHIVVDFEDVNEDTDLVKKAIDGQRFIWNLRHNITIKGHDVELYIQDEKETHNASGLYSLLNHKWITKPTYDPPDVDTEDIDVKYESRLSDINRYEKLSEKDLSPDESEEYYEGARDLKDKIMKSRKKGLIGEGEFSIENLVFKKLRNEGDIKRLIDIITSFYDKIYSQ